MFCSSRPTLYLVCQYVLCFKNLRHKMLSITVHPPYTVLSYVHTALTVTLCILQITYLRAFLTCVCASK